MAYVTVPKDLAAIKTKVMFNLTKRQLISFSMGAAVGLCVYSACNSLTDSSNALTFMMFSMFPFFMIGMYEKNGQHLEVILLQVYQVKFGTAKLRPYQAQNFYEKLEEQYNVNKEVTDIVRTVQQPKSKENTPKTGNKPKQ